MISFIKGELKEVGIDFVVVENHGIGYLIKVPATVVTMLPEIGSEIQIFTYLYIREDILDLSGL